MGIRALCSVAMLVAVSTAQAQVSEPTLHTSTRIVAVTIVATHSNGSPVNDLRASDIRVFDNKKEQTIASFEAMETSSTRDTTHKTVSAPTSLPVASGYPHFSIILLDALNTEWSDQMYARRAVEHLLDYLPQGERVAIFVLGDHLYLQHDFSSNVVELRASLQHLSVMMPHGGVASSPSSPFSAELSGSDLVRFSNQTRLQGARSSNEALFFQRNRILQTFLAMTAIARLVKNAPGQKNLLWISSAFPLDLTGPHGPLDIESFHDQAKKATDEMNSDSVRIYPVDARGLSVNSHAYINIGTMQELAEQTGGKAFYNNNDLPSEMRLALEDSREGYLLTYTPKDFHEDKSFHTIRLRVSRPGVHLRYRRGYYAEPAQSLANAKGTSRKRK